jgi:hypothetical protein
MLSDSWFHEVFRQWPDLIVRSLGEGKAGRAWQGAGLQLWPLAGCAYEAPVLKGGEQRLDGVLVPPEETAEWPVVILEVQMFADALFLHRPVCGTGRRW